jgi:hypothetical protein
MHQPTEEENRRAAMRKLLAAVADMAAAGQRAEAARRELLDTPTRYSRIRLHKPARGQEAADE